MHAPHLFHHNFNHSARHEHGPGYWFVVLAALIVLFGVLLGTMMWLSEPEGPSSNDPTGVILLLAS